MQPMQRTVAYPLPTDYAAATNMAESEEQFSEHCPFSGHAVIGGFGVPGRAVGEMLAARGMCYCVIELNPRTVDRCLHTGIHMIAGDVAAMDTLRRAGVERAALLVLAIPNEAAVLEAVRLARAMNPKLHIMARCHYISVGMEARRRGANEVVIEEKVVGEELVRLLKQGAMEKSANV